MGELLTTRQVAAELRVSESSVKRWCDQGMIRTQRTAGGHRRIERSSLHEFLSETAAREGSFRERTVTADALQPLHEPLATATSPKRVAEASDTYQLGPTRQELVERFEQGLLRGDEAACLRVIDQWSSRYPGMARFGDGLVAGAMERIGHLWESGRAEVFQERRSCEICGRLIHQFRQKIATPGPRAPRAIGGTLAGDHYALSSQLVELVLREAGWNATSLGTHLPYGSLLAAVQQERPRLLWLSISHIAEPDHFVETYNQFYAQLPADLLVVVGGRALTDDLRPCIGYTAHCGNLEKLSALAQVISGAQ